MTSRSALCPIHTQVIPTQSMLINVITIMLLLCDKSGHHIKVQKSEAYYYPKTVSQGKKLGIHYLRASFSLELFHPRGGGKLPPFLKQTLVNCRTKIVTRNFTQRRLKS